MLVLNLSETSFWKKGQHGTKILRKASFPFLSAQCENISGSSKQNQPWAMKLPPVKKQKASEETCGKSDVTKLASHKGKSWEWDQFPKPEHIPSYCPWYLARWNPAVNQSFWSHPRRRRPCCQGGEGTGIVLESVPALQFTCCPRHVRETSQQAELPKTY